MTTKQNDYIRRELRITGILDKRDEYRRNWFQHLRRIPQNRIPPFEIALLQTTRKENNWKTEETLERVVISLETLMFMMMTSINLAFKLLIASRISYLLYVLDVLIVFFFLI